MTSVNAASTGSKLLALLLVVAIAAVLAEVRMQLPRPQVDDAVIRMDGAIEQLPHPPDTQEVERIPWHGLERASIKVTYETARTENEVLDFYSGHLRSLGWQPGASPGALRLYCKDDLILTLEFPEGVPRSRLVYEIALSWRVWGQVCPQTRLF
jgi:hypothetical protein